MPPDDPLVVVKMRRHLPSTIAEVAIYMMHES